jgi:hypothetical protein
VGPDHLLSVTRIWMNEDYKRFYFRDIQAITLDKNNSAPLRNWILGTFAFISFALFGVIGTHSARPWSPAPFIAGAIIGGVFMVLLLVNLLRGPTCNCKLRTAVQIEELPSLGRIRVAGKAIAILKPLIEAVQGEISPQDIVSGIAQPAAPRRTLLETQKPFAATAQPPPHLLPPATGGLHAALYAVVLMDSAAGFFKHLYPAWHSYLLVSCPLLIAVCGLSFAAVIRQRRHAISKSVARLTNGTLWGVIAIMMVLFVYGIIARTLYLMQHPGRMPTHIDFYLMPWFRQLSLYTDCVEAAVGFAGLGLTLLWMSGRRISSTASAAPPASTPPAGPQP